MLSGGGFCRLAIAIAIVLCATAGVAAAQSRGLDHGAHARAVAATKLATSCATCHPGDTAGRLRRRPDHRTCFSRCHTPMPPAQRPGRPYTIEDERRPLCLVCHAARDLDAAARGSGDRLAASAPPADRRDHLLTMSHKTHAPAGCASCHRFGRAGRPHDRCRGCHSKAPAVAALSMRACERCHRPAVPKLRSLGSEPSPYTTGARFSHQRHAPRLGAAKAPCLTCHAGLDQLAGNVVPRPRKSSCTGCHDGKTAFSTTEARCRACHDHPPVPAGERNRSDARFDHDVHTATDCVSCHPNGGRFDTSVGHTTCAAAACHADDYAQRAATLCGTCHLGNEPWLDQHVDRPARTASDFGVRFDHGRHAKPERACTSCHIGDPDARDVGLTSGHAACSGAGCHDSRIPKMTACADCHRLSARGRRRRAAANRRWSVRQTFRHATHKLGEDAKPLPCSACHPKPTKPGPLPTPRKATCLGCHDGSPAFKATGHGCVRCHRGG